MNFFTAIFGAGVLGSVIALRTYVGIALVMMVTTCSFKADIIDYIKDSKRQAHEEKMAQIAAEADKEKSHLDQCQKNPQVQMALGEIKIGQEVRVQLLEELKNARESGDVIRENRVLKSFSDSEKHMQELTSIVWNYNCQG